MQCARHSTAFRAWCASAALALGTLATLPAAAGATLEQARKEGVIRIGFANEAPFGYATPAGAVTGEAPEIAKIVLKKMGVAKVEGVLTEFGSLIPGLEAGRFDIIAAGMFITPERCRRIAFSEPTYGVGQALLVKKGNPRGLSSYADVARNPGVKLAIMAGAVEENYAKSAGVKEKQLVVLPDPPAMLAAVQSGRAEAAALTAPSIEILAEEGDGVEMTAPFGTVAGRSVTGHGAFGFRKEDEELRAAFNKNLASFIGSREHIALVQPFGFGKEYLPDKTTAELCRGS